MAECLADEGIDGVDVVQGGITFESAFDWEADDYQVANFVCTLRYPTQPSMIGYLSEAQLRFTYRYWATATTPCLRLLGYNIPDPPREEYFVETFYSSVGWNPYNILYQHPMDERDWELVEFRCPQLPEKLGLRYY